MKRPNLHSIVRILFGLGMAFFGLNNLLHFMPPHDYEGMARQVMAGFIASGYVMPAVGTVQMLLGTALLLNRLVAPALLLFVPIAVNILLFHLYLDRPGIFPGLVINGLTLYLLLAHRDRYQFLLSR